MQIYLVVENVDLGYHVVHGYTDNVRAVQECQRLIEIHNAQLRERLGHCGYTEADAQEYIEHFTTYEVVTVGVE